MNTKNSNNEQVTFFFKGKKVITSKKMAISKLSSIFVLGSDDEKKEASNILFLLNKGITNCRIRKENKTRPK